MLANHKLVVPKEGVNLTTLLQQGPFILCTGDNFHAQLANQTTSDNFDPNPFTRLPEHIYPKIKKLYTTPGRYTVLSYDDCGVDVFLKIGSRKRNPASNFVVLDTSVFGGVAVKQLSFEYEIIRYLTSDGRLWQTIVNPEDDTEHVITETAIQLNKQDDMIVSIKSGYDKTLALTKMGYIYDVNQPATCVHQPSGEVGKATNILGGSHTFLYVINDLLYDAGPKGVNSAQLVQLPFPLHEIDQVIGNKSEVFYLTSHREIYMSSNQPSIRKLSTQMLIDPEKSNEYVGKVITPASWKETIQYPVAIGCPCSEDLFVLTNKGQVWVAGSNRCQQFGRGAKYVSSELRRMVFPAEHESKTHLAVTDMSFGYWSAYFLFSQPKSSSLFKTKSFQKNEKNKVLFDVVIVMK